MNVSEQRTIAASKENQILGLIKSNISYKEGKLIILLYKAIVKPHNVVYKGGYHIVRRI